MGNDISNLDDDDEEDEDDGHDNDPLNDGKSKGQSTLRRDSIASDSSSLQEKKLQNQFSFVERATQTMNNSHKVWHIEALAKHREKMFFGPALVTIKDTKYMLLPSCNTI